VQYSVKDAKVFPPSQREGYFIFLQKTHKLVVMGRVGMSP
jgi:hypothetical protein